MTSDRTVSPGDLLPDVLAVLADVLGVPPEKLDAEQTFQSLGFDSLLTVEFVAVLNARYGLQLLPTELYDHPSPGAFARRLAREPGRTDGAGPVPAAARTGTPPATDAQAAPYGESRPPAATRAFADGGAVLGILREQLAAILCCDPREIDPTASFPLLGVDSVIGTELVSVLNRTFGLRELAVTLHDHPNLAELAAHIATRTGAAPVPAEPAAAAQHITELDVLLDAVRDDRLTVDEALVLLGRRG
ncbi:acyl carrier protein [Streptomyces sp. NPDC102402]|uniref:acyl carrier protein n=1 Tax=Streptomyces sp. NPDC102402 TaxID=3366169 RepID=UPI00380EB5F8